MKTAPRIRAPLPSGSAAHNHRYRGYVYIAMAAVCWGISATLGRAAFSGRLLPGSGVAKVNPLILSQARTTFSFVVVLLALLVLRGPHFLRIPVREIAKMAVLGLAGVAASNYFYYLAIQRTNVATAIVLQYTAPIWVLLYMVVRGREKATISKSLSVAMAVLGIAMVIGLVGHSRLQPDVIGVSAALVASLAFSYYNVFGHSILVRYDRWTVLLFTTMAASLFWIVINPPAKIAGAHYSLPVWVFLVVFSMLSVLLPFTFYFAGLECLAPTKAIITSCLEPVVSILIAAFALNEKLYSLQAVGIAMVLGAIIVVQRPVRGDVDSVVVEPVD